jgi:phosphoribosylglycinamide formyltransferase-1
MPPQSDCLRVAFFASHTGSSMRAVVEWVRDVKLAIEPALCISNNRNAAALQFARMCGLAAYHVSDTLHGTHSERMMLAALGERRINLIVLSGFLRRLPARVVEQWAGRVINVHPSLIPKYCGTGMYGDRVHEAVLAAREHNSGATVHLVDEEYDHGLIVAQSQVPVKADDTVSALRGRVQAAEHALLISVVRGLAMYPNLLPLTLETVQQLHERLAAPWATAVRRSGSDGPRADLPNVQVTLQANRGGQGVVTLSLWPMGRLLTQACASDYAIPAFNFDSFDVLFGIMTGSLRASSPVIVQITEPALDFLGIQNVVHIVSNEARR